jgi:Sulfotransferase family
VTAPIILESPDSERRQPMRERRCVIVAGFARSGTSWLAKGLSFADGFTYYREPDNVDMVPGAEERFRYLYLTGEHDDPAYRRLMTRACTGRIATAFTMKEDPGPLLTALGLGRRVGERFPVLFMRKRDVLVKLVNANLNLAWFSANFPRARQVFVLRHPCGQFESWKRLGWEPDPHRLLENRRLVADHLQPFAELITRARSFWERAAALWAAVVHVVHRQTEQAEGGRLIVAYEWLCADPITRFQDLYRRLDLRWTPRAEQFIRASDTEADPGTYSMRRPTARQIDKWKQGLTRDEIEACRRFVEPFRLPYYPSFEPRVGSLSGDQRE